MPEEDDTKASLGGAPKDGVFAKTNDPITTDVKPTDAKVQSVQQRLGDVTNRVAEKIEACNNILVALSSDPNVDEFSAAIGLTMILNSIGKHATAIYSGETPAAIEFLKPENTFEKNTNSLQDFIIALNKDKADHLRYKVEGDYVKIYITPYKTTITDKDLEFSQGDFNVDLVISIDVADGELLDGALSEYGRIMHDATAINITTNAPGKFAEIEWSDPSVSSVCEMIASISNKIGYKKFDKNVATALLTGIVANTEHFSNARTTSETMAIAAKLMEAGADQQLISSNILAPEEEEKKEEPEEKPVEEPKAEEKEEPKKPDEPLIPAPSLSMAPTDAPAQPTPNVPNLAPQAMANMPNQNLVNGQPNYSNIQNSAQPSQPFNPTTLNLPNSQPNQNNAQSNSNNLNNNPVQNNSVQNSENGNFAQNNPNSNFAQNNSNNNFATNGSNNNSTNNPDDNSPQPQNNANESAGDKTSFNIPNMPNPAPAEQPAQPDAFAFNIPNQPSLSVAPQAMPTTNVPTDNPINTSIVQSQNVQPSEQNNGQPMPATAPNAFEQPAPMSINQSAPTNQSAPMPQPFQMNQPAQTPANQPAPSFQNEPNSSLPGRSNADDIQNALNNILNQNTAAVDSNSLNIPVPSANSQNPSNTPSANNSNSSNSQNPNSQNSLNIPTTPTANSSNNPFANQNQPNNFNSQNQSTNNQFGQPQNNEPMKKSEPMPEIMAHGMDMDQNVSEPVPETPDYGKMIDQALVEAMRENPTTNPATASAPNVPTQSPAAASLPEMQFNIPGMQQNPVSAPANTNVVNPTTDPILPPPPAPNVDESGMPPIIATPPQS